MKTETVKLRLIKIFKEMGFSINYLTGKTVSLKTSTNRMFEMDVSVPHWRIEIKYDGEYTVRSVLKDAIRDYTEERRYKSETWLLKGIEKKINMTRKSIWYRIEIEEGGIKEIRIKALDKVHARKIVNLIKGKHIRIYSILAEI